MEDQDENKENVILKEDYKEIEEKDDLNDKENLGNLGEVSLDTSMKLPIKNHISRLEGMLEEVIMGIEECKKSLQILRSEFLTMSHVKSEQINDVSKEVLDEAIRIEKDFKKLTDVENAENKFLKQQLAVITQERIKIQQNILVLENRIEETEKDVGFKFSLSQF